MAGELNPAASIVSWSNKPENTPPSTTTTTAAIDDKQGLPTIGQKRQRRPSVRLGDIKPLVTAHHPRPKPFSNSRSRPLTNLDSHSKRPLTNFTRVHYDDDDDDDGDNNNHEDDDNPVNVNSADEDEGVWHHRRPIRGNLDDGVRKLLLDLGLSRYAPLFELHEVDDHVLPHLTLEDLKDMGITAVGSRRKLHTAIVNLRKHD